MKFGIIELSQPDKDVEVYPYREVHERVTKEIIEADKDGYDYVWIAEHHASTGYGILPDPLTYIAYLATLTERITLCSGVMVVPLHNVVRLVENISFVDILTNGRIAFGIGSGYREHEFEALGADFENRRAYQAEALEVMMSLFHDHQVEHKGVAPARHQHHRRLRSAPHPVQQPHPPMYMGAASEESIALVRGTAWALLMSTLTPMQQLAPKAQFYLEQCNETEAPYNANPGHGSVGIGRMVYVAETDEQAKEEAGESVCPPRALVHRCVHVGLPRHDLPGEQGQVPGAGLRGSVRGHDHLRLAGDGDRKDQVHGRAHRRELADPALPALQQPRAEQAGAATFAETSSRSSVLTR